MILPGILGCLVFQQSLNEIAVVEVVLNVFEFDETCAVPAMKNTISVLVKGNINS